MIRHVCRKAGSNITTELQNTLIFFTLLQVKDETVGMISCPLFSFTKHLAGISVASFRNSHVREFRKPLRGIVWCKEAERQILVPPVDMLKCTGKDYYCASKSFSAARDWLFFFLLFFGSENISCYRKERDRFFFIS